MSDAVSRRVRDLAVYERSTTVDDAQPWVVLVHGSMDRGASFVKATRRLPSVHAVRYDRRGYGRSRNVGVATSIEEHVDDLVAVLDSVASQPDASVPGVVVGHSFGGVLALAATQARPELVTAVGAFEAPMPWTPWWPSRSAGGDAVGVGRDGGPEEAAERFMRRMVGDERWEKLPPSTRADRRAEGAALVAELGAMRGRTTSPYDLTAISQPVIAGSGSLSSLHHIESARLLAEGAHTSELVVIEGSGHGAHYSHPDEFARFIELVQRSGAGVT